MIRVISIAVLMCAHFLCAPAWAATFSAKAAVEKTDPFVGEPFVFQIQVSGSEHPEQPDLSLVKDFAVAFQGGQQNSRRSVTIINGRVTEDVQEGYFFSYELTPKREGRLVIPSIIVISNGRSTQTHPVVINARKPAETEDFKLRMSLSKEHCYVGEPVILTVTWFIGKDVRDYRFTLPLLNDDTFRFADPEVDTQSGNKVYRIPLGDGEAVGIQGRGREGGKQYATITFQKVLIPVSSGHVTIEPATVACSALTGYERQRSLFDDDFFGSDFFGTGRRGIYKTVVVPSNALDLRISDLPLEERPANFAGHVGDYQIETRATPTEVNVGDPITLTLSLSGPAFLEYVELPPLNEQLRLAGDFKVPKERATAEILGKSKVFTQTIRALRPDVKEIPSIELPYFDTITGTYRVARSEPIPLTVNKTRIITALDAEGVNPVEFPGSEIETWTKGIAFNYEDMGVLVNQRLTPLSWFRLPLWISLFAGPPLCYVLLLSGIALIRNRNADPMKARARKAFGRLERSLKQAQGSPTSAPACDMVQEAFRHYLGDKLRMAKGALTFNDVKEALKAKGLDPGTLDRLKALFERCEAGRYAGIGAGSDSSSIVEQGILLAKDLEKKLK
ncbi:MAG: BatD family protein [Deltaproteobacteria bacterium]|nr:BatD family protein [Deltaproteobacteria bacterium]